MLSKREFAEMRRLATEYNTPQVESELLHELLDEYQKHHPEVRTDRHAEILRFPRNTPDTKQ